MGKGILAVAAAVVAGYFLLKNWDKITGSKTGDKQRMKFQAKKEIDYDSIIEEIEREYYPKFLSYNLYMKSKICRLPADILEKLDKEYGLRMDEPVIDFGDVKFDLSFHKALKRRMEKEPRVLGVLTMTGNVLFDYHYFLNKKAELEAKSIIDKITGSQNAGDGEA